MTIPDYRTTEHLHAEEHRRLACATCHSQWAPQCYGCHSQYEPEGRQWDHLLQQQTPGRWRETRWDVRALARRTERLLQSPELWQRERDRSIAVIERLLAEQQKLPKG